MSFTVFVPCDSAALAAGADEVVDAIHKEAAARGLAIDVQRNSSRGMFWLEPLVEVVTAQGRVSYGPVAFEDVPSLFAADFLNGGQHALSLGVTDQIPYLAKQQRLTFARMGITRPLSLDDYAAHGGWVGLKNAWPWMALLWCKKCWTLACVVAVARLFLQASSGARCVPPRQLKNTWSAMPMKVTRAPSRTA
jgi:hypothetical protein